ncbi:MAG: YggS family pyridoxal phosphate-dependent enzyme [Crocinitomicaceae bacterium]|nr:YggS family pyridoxal phosphate-dependent enzyme [Crocinitomicaceae bacterium]
MIANKLQKLYGELPKEVTLVAVSKTKPIADLQDAYDAGQRVFGENKVQEMCTKWEQLPKEINWHFIGHLQRNKVKYLAPFVDLIHGVESFRLLKEINKQAQKNNRVIDVLLQFFIANEETKFGLSFEEAEAILSDENFKELQNVRICGVMGMASFSNNQEQIREEFKTLKSTFDKLKSTFFDNEKSFNVISMGMSGDYNIALEEGSTMIRVGSSIFGKRN